MGNAHSFQRKRRGTNMPPTADTSGSLSPLSSRTPLPPSPDTQVIFEPAGGSGFSLERLAIHRPERNEAERDVGEHASLTDVASPRMTPSSEAGEANPIATAPQQQAISGYSLANLPIVSPDRGAIQRKERSNRRVTASAGAQDASVEEIQQAAQEGKATPVSAFPYQEEIQQAFGHHRIDQIQAHINPQATLSAQAMHAAAYTTGDHVVFAGTPDLHTAAHEAAHVIQQRAGIQLPDAVGRVGDSYEQQADAVAARVTQGQSAEHLLDASGTGEQQAKRNTAPSPVSQRLVQRVLTSGSSAAQLSATETGNDYGAAGYFEVRKTWQVTPPTEGVIVQHVTRTFQVWEVDLPTQMTAQEINDYVTGSSQPYADITEYWEAWTVDASGKVSDGGEDTFSLCSIKPGRSYKHTTKGTFIIAGQANFYPIASPTPATLGFAQNGVATAGGLFSTTTDPTANLGAASGNPVFHSVTVTWNTALKDKRLKDASGGYVAGDGDSHVTSNIF